MTAAQLTFLIQKEHQQLHAQLFPAISKIADVKLRVITEDEVAKHIPNLVSAYRDSEDSITIAMNEGDLTDDFRMKGSPFLGVEPIWKTDILHETIHEYQFKCVKQATKIGQEFKSQCKRIFPGNGHDETFYTAIVECAEKLGLSPADLEARI